MKIRTRFQLGPDVLRVLNNYSTSLTNSPRTLNGYRVQRDSDNNPAITIDATSLEKVGVSHPDSYETFIGDRLFDRSNDLSRSLGYLRKTERAKVLSGLLEDAQGDPELWWALSFPKVRRFIFPGAYDEATRTDCVIYRFSKTDPECGRIIPLPDLKPATVKRFVSDATKVMRSDVDPVIFTPIQLEAS